MFNRPAHGGKNYPPPTGEPKKNAPRRLLGEGRFSTTTYLVMVVVTGAFFFLLGKFGDDGFGGQK